MKYCLASISSISSKNIESVNQMVAEHKILYTLESFYYFKEFQIPYIQQCNLFLLDSGAFTFISQSKRSIDWNEYLNSYIEFINKHNVKYFFELDIDCIVGYEKVLKMRKQLESKTNKKCIPVWHISRGIEEFKKMIQNYDYIAVGGFAAKEIKQSDYPKIKKLIRYANSNNTKVHGLGYSRQDCLDYGFYSCDSTSWLSGVRFGKCYKFANDRMAILSVPNKRTTTEFYAEHQLSDLNEWIKYQHYLERY